MIYAAEFFFTSWYLSNVTGSCALWLYPHVRYCVHAVRMTLCYWIRKKLC